MPGSIAIITNEFNSKIEGTRYFLAHLITLWNQQGLKVHVTEGCNYIPADIAFLHVDTSVVADEYLELGQRYPVALNGNVKSILKSNISKYLLKRDDPYTGPVIVKTDANYGGANEFVNAVKSGRRGWIDPEVERPWRKREVMDPLNYPVFNSLSEVPTGVWKNKRLVVEKFLPERLENGDYRTGTYVFFGEQECAFWMTSPKPVVKSAVATDLGMIDKIPQSIRQIRKAFGFDYGKFDYTEVDGEVIVYDMNKTPALGSKLVNMISNQKMRDLATEILSFG
jgi:hypothetical protein